MIDELWIKALAKTLVLPPGGPLLLALVGLLIRRRYFRAGGILVWVGVLLLFVLSLPIVGWQLQRSLDRAPVFDQAQIADAKAVVILGGGLRHDAPEYGGDTLNALTLERVRYGAIVARQTKLPVLVSGGAASKGDPEAKVMRDVLEREYGVPVRWIESESRTTHENALRSAAILRAAGINQVVLVVHSFDMPRAVAEFAAAGIASVPAPTGGPSEGAFSLFDCLPSIGGLQASYYALYEIAANAVRWLSRAAAS